MIYYNRPERSQWLCKLLEGKQGALWCISDVKMANRTITELQGLLKKFLKSNKYKDNNGIKNNIYITKCITCTHTVIG